MINIKDIPDDEVQIWYKEQKREFAFYIATPGLGECIAQTPIMQSLHDEGKNVVLVMRKNYVSAFMDAPFLYDIMECQEDELLYNNGVVRLSDAKIERINSLNSIVVSPLQLDGVSKYRGAVYTQNQPRSLYPCSSNSPTDAYASIVGIDPKQNPMYVSRGKSLFLPTKPNVGLCIGSDEQFRRIPDSTFRSIITCITNSFQLYLFGTKYYGQTEPAHSVLDTSLYTSLGYLSRLDVFVTPDTGFLHAAIALEIPTIYLQSRECGENLIPESYWKYLYHFAVDDDFLSCNRDCRAKMYEKYIGNDARPSMKWRGASCNISPDYPNDLTCGGSIDCLRLISGDTLTKTIQEIIDANRN